MSTRVRVLHVIDSLDLGGAQTVLYNLLRSSNQERFEVAVATMHGKGVFWNQYAQLGIPLHSLSPRKEVPLYLLNLVGLIRKWAPQVVHCHLFGSNWIAKPIAAMLGVPVRISHDHCNDGLRYDQGWARWLDIQANRLSSHICAVSSSTREFLLERESLPADQVSLVYNGVDLEKFAVPGGRPRRDRFVVLGVGRLVYQKNFALFLEVAGELIREGLPICFRIAGTGPDESALREQVEALGIGGAVEFLGHVQDTARLYAEADALLLTSRFEGTPMTALEAMAAGLPLVASRLDGLAEILLDEEDALLADAQDAAGFARHLRRLVAEPELAKRLAASALIKVRGRYSAAAMAATIEAIYERCLVKEPN